MSTEPQIYCVRCAGYATEHVHCSESISDTMVMVDLDSTLADTRQRHHMAPTHNPTSSWGQYASLSGGDALFDGVAVMVSALYEVHQVHIVSGRDASSYPITLKWLSDKGVDYDVLRLWTDGDVKNNEQFKLDYINRMRAFGLTTTFAVDDWPGVHHLLTANGIPTVVVNPMYDDDVMKSFAESYVEPPVAVSS